jgi:sugar-specific transcriptional regulator TrmB
MEEEIRDQFEEFRKEIAKLQKEIKALLERARPDPATSVTVQVSQIIDDLKEAVNLVNEETDFPIKSAEIALKICTAVGGGVQLSILNSLTGELVFTRTHVSETHIVFVPKKKPKTLKAMDDNIPLQIRMIKEAIIRAGNIFPNWSFESASIVNDFTISEKGGISFILTGNEEVDGTHSLIINF